MSGFFARRRVTAIIGAAAAATAIATGSAAAYAAPAPAPHKHPVVVPHVPRSLINRALPSAVIPGSRPAGMARANASQDGSVDVGDLGLWYFDSAHGYGSVYDTSHNDNWLFDNHFISAGAGQHAVVANDSEFAWNRDPHTTVIVCTGYNYTGSCGTIGPNVYGNFTSTYRDNVESVYWADSAN
jgi:hypothetical protein